MKSPTPHRDAVARANRVVVKIGSRVLVQRSGRPDMQRMRMLVADLAALRKSGREVVVVSSGAIGAGMEAMGLTARPANLPDLQMAAAIGQTRLMTRYDRLFAARQCRIGQVLLTHDGLKDRRRHLNARNTVMNLLRHGVIPIVNENDVVAVDEIKLGDNDLLAALVALLIQADLLVLLTTTNGLRQPLPNGRTRRVSLLEEITPAVRRYATGSDNHLSVGGMATKLQAADDVVRTGGLAVIADGRKPGALVRILAGEDFGTLIAPPAGRRNQSLSGRKRWIAFFHRTHGSLHIDDGACTAILQRGKSLLPIGVRKVAGSFKAGDVVNIKAPDGSTIARGLVDYSSEEVNRIKGHRTTEIAAILGAKDYDEIVHRDNMVLLSTPKTGAK